MWPEPPLRSSSVGSLLAFIASMHISSRSRSPLGSSTEVQKNVRPPMSAAPSISTPLLPPSFTTFLILLFRSFSASSFDGAFVSSFAALGFLSFFPSFFAAASCFGTASFLTSFFGAGSFFGAPSFLVFSFFDTSSFLGEAAPPHNVTSPKTCLNSGCIMHVLNHLIRFCRGFRISGVTTCLKPSATAQQTQMSASVILSPAM
mmetsp:Transcript_12490/g.20541  ORF Transcript_12490/g.20541 Transcript_12490/m.20541 type:complete len:203 (+) Transcript_12490:373-981(+)